MWTYPKQTAEERRQTQLRERRGAEKHAQQRAWDELEQRARVAAEHHHHKQVRGRFVREVQSREAEVARVKLGDVLCNSENKIGKVSLHTDQ